MAVIETSNNSQSILENKKSPSILENRKSPESIYQDKKFNDDQIIKFWQKKLNEQKKEAEKKEKEIIDKDPETKQVKYSFKKEDPNSIYNDRNLIETAKAYFYIKDGKTFDTDEAVVKEYISDRTWKQANTYSIGKELIYATSESVDQDQKRRLSYLIDYWNKLPNFYEDGGRGWISGIGSNLARGILDPTNLIGPGVAKLTIGTAISQAAKTGTKLAVKKAVPKAIVYGTGAQFAADSLVGASVDAAVQATEKELMLRNKFDAKRMFQAAIIQGGIGIVPGLPYTYTTAKAMSKSAELDALGNKAAQTVFDYAHPVKDLNFKLYGIKSNIEGYKSKGKDIDNLLKDFLNDNPDSQLGKKIKNYFDIDKDPQVVGAGLKLSKKEIRLLTKQSSRDSKKINYLDQRSPGDSGYAHLRELAASTTRADAAIRADGKVILPVTAERTKLGVDKEIIVKGGYEQTNAKPLLKIYEPLQDKKLVNVFNNYVEAQRSRVLNERGISTSMKKADINKALKEFESQPKDNRILLNRTLDDLKLYTETLLELSRRTGVISQLEYIKIKSANPIYAPFYRKTAAATIRDLKKYEPEAVARIPQEGATRVIEAKPVEKVGGVKTPAKYKITGSDADIEPIHRSLMDYTFHVYQAAEKNLAKQRVYSEIDDAVLKGYIGKNEIVRALSPVESTNVITKSLVKALEKEADHLGIKFSKKLKEGLLEGEDAIKVAAFKNSIKLQDGKIIDLVYKNGKLKMYEIKDPAFVEMFKSLGGVTGNYIGGLEKIVNGLISPTRKGGTKLEKTFRIVGKWSRVFPNLITHSPPFIAFNGIRDTLSGSINSAFGFNALGFFPGLDTARGLFKTFKPLPEMLKGLGNVVNPKHPNFLRLMKGMKEAFGMSRTYQKGLLAGGGFASRRDTEKLVTQIVRNIKNHKSKDKKVYLESFNFLKDIGYFGLDLAKAYAQLVNRIEYASRLGEFQLAKKAGMDDKIAGFAMREISTDFGMHGSSAALNAYNRVTMFFNAGLEGFYRSVIRRPLENKGRVTAGVLGTIVAPELIFWALSNETPEYEELSEDVKLLNYTIPIYMEDKPDGSHLRTLADGSIQRRIKHFFLVPKPYDFGAFANIFRGMAEAVQEGAPEIAVEYFYLSIAKVFPGLTKPTLVSPVIDLVRNKNFKDEQIIPYYKAKGMYADQLINSNTTFTARKIADTLNEMYRQLPTNQDDYAAVISPITIDYLVSNYFVGLAEYIPSMVEAKYAWDEEAFGPKPKGRIDENDISNNIFSVVTRRFFSKTTPTKFNKNISLLFELKAKAQKIKLDANTASNDIVKLFQNQGIDVNRLTRQQLRDALKVSDILAVGLDTISELRKQREITKLKKYDSGGILFTAESKLKAIEEIRLRENELAYNILNNIINLQDPTFLTSIMGTKLYKDYNKKNIKTRPIQKIFSEIQSKFTN